MINDLWYKNAVIYCLSVSTYMDANGDGIGDFQGLMRRLDYLHGLGITAVWLMPFQTSQYVYVPCMALIYQGIEAQKVMSCKPCLVPHPLLILGYSRFNFVRASSILNCQSTPRCLALVLSAQIPISDWSKGSSPMRRSVRH